ncbi:hypothetical protein ES319_A05G403500v1 [Gossypium barbadense]|uniref:CSC1/OSCA1-like N-terminal transmembrane domain-containing protein n=1 Tax=Gossypium barbadense TaxID=3634 RepID=A0A5J5W0W2_GOSBA|nr:hypothetical protein ES319_A05G403500v1 [Gossypium barbadense]
MGLLWLTKKAAIVRVFAFACVVGIFVLLPVNFSGDRLTIDFSNLPNKTLESFSVSNVNDGSNRLVHRRGQPV